MTTRWKITGALGLMLTLVGLGLQLAGVQLRWLGWAIIAIGLAIGLGALLVAFVRWAWSRFAVAVARTASAHGYRPFEAAGAREREDEQTREFGRSPSQATKGKVSMSRRSAAKRARHP